MFRTLLLRSASIPVRQTTILLRPSIAAAAPITSSVRSNISSSKWTNRSYSAAAGLSKEAISERVLDVIKSFEKVDGGKLTANAAFTSDLGLDSLDAVEVVMAIEEEFGIEIPDAEADEITTVAQAIDYIAKTPEAH